MSIVCLYFFWKKPQRKILNDANYFVLFDENDTGDVK